MSNCIDPLNINFKPSYEGELLLLGACSYTATEKDGSLNWKENEELKVYGDPIVCSPNGCSYILTEPSLGNFQYQVNVACAGTCTCSGQMPLPSYPPESSPYRYD